jgi:hypothetical protein
MAGFWESALPGLAGGFGYAELLDRLDKEKGDIGNYMNDIRDQVTQSSTFTPWSVTSGLGNVTAGPEGINYGLSNQQQGIADQMFGSGQDLLGRAAADPRVREQEIYDRIRASQIPEEQRYKNTMDQNLFSRGRLGMGTADYGSSSEQFGYEKARAEAQNSAMLGAMGQAQNELMNQYTMGSGMLGLGYSPYNQLNQQAGMGLNNAQLGSQYDLNRANLMAQLGLGELGTKLNYSNVQGNAFGNMIGALAPALGGVGGAIDGSDGLWDLLKSINPF